MEILFLLLPIALGILAGIAAGLIPGIHTNTIAAILVALYFMPDFREIDPSYFIVFVASMAITNTFFDVFPSLFLGIPSAEIYALLPGHRMVKEGRGYEALSISACGSFMGFFISILLCLGVILIDCLTNINLIESVYNFIKDYIFWILLAIVLVLVITDKNKIWALIMVLTSGLFGLVVLGFPKVPHPDSAFNAIFPALVGIFGMPGLLSSMLEKNDNLATQIEDNLEKLSDKKSSFFGTFGGMITGLLPGLGSANAAACLLLIQEFRNKKEKENSRLNQKQYLTIISSIGTADALFSIVALYFISKSRSGASVAIEQIVSSINISSIMAIFGAMAISSVVAFYLIHLIKGVIIEFFGKVAYKALTLAVIVFLVLVTFLTTGLWGIIILIIATILGAIPYVVNIRRAQAMGFFLIPVLLFFSGYEAEILTGLSLESRRGDFKVFSLKTFLIGAISCVLISFIVYFTTKKILGVTSQDVQIIKNNNNNRKDTSKWYLLFTLILGVVLLFLSQILENNNVKQNTKIISTVQSIVDGDTIHFVANDQIIKCRVAGIDTPEKFESKKLDNFIKKYNFDKKQIQEAGKIATQFAETFFKDKQEYEIQLVGKDIYKRNLCVIKKDNLIYNIEAVKNGYAVVYKQGKYTQPAKLANELSQAQFLAIENKKGLWNKNYELMIKMSLN